MHSGIVITLQKQFEAKIQMPRRMNVFYTIAADTDNEKT
jgi:hypothetical protein